MNKVSWKIVLLAVSFFISSGLRADPITAAFEFSGKVVGAYTVQELTDKATMIINETLSEGESAGKSIVSSAAESVNISIANFNVVAGHQGSQLISALSKERQAVAFALIQSLVQFQKGLGQVRDFGDTFLLSFESTINDSVLGAFSEKYIVVQRFSGRAQLQGANEHAIAITATNIGLGTSNIQNDFEILSNDIPISFKASAKDRHKRIFYLDESALDKKFEADELIELPLTIKFKQTHSRWYWFDKVIEHQLNTSLVLYPNQLSNLEVSYDVPTMKWSDVGSISQRSTNSCHGCPTGRAFHLSLEVPGGDSGEATPLNAERLTNVQCRCITGGRCWYDDHGNAGAHTLNYSSNMSSATCRGHHRTKPTTWVLSATKQRYVPDESEKRNLNIEGKIDQVIEVRVPHNAIAIRLKGKLITGDTINVGLDPLSDSSGRVSVTGLDVNHGLEKIIHLSIIPPQTPVL